MSEEEKIEESRKTGDGNPACPAGRTGRDFRWRNCQYRIIIFE